MSNFEFTKDDVEYLIEQAGLCYDNGEVDVFLLRWRGKSITAIAMQLGMSNSTVDRRIASIKRKITRVLK